jgi:hypothetical protein
MNNTIMEIEKIKGEDCRALQKRNLLKLMDKGKLHPYVELVKKHSELELGFRGNGDPERISIYLNNHQIFKIEQSGAVYVSFNHARYCENWKEYLDVLQEYKFNIPVEILASGGKDSIGELKRNSLRPELSTEEVEVLYTKAVKPMFERYFEVEGCNDVIDYFKKKVGEKNYVARPASLTEKKEQQKLYSAIRDKKSGFFFYDLEFAQKHENKKAQDDDENNNKPDMQAIKFNEEGKPDKLVFVEVKCTKSAWDGGTSGLVDHIKRMREYENDRINMSARRKEAYLILKQYSMLGLRGLNAEDWFEYDDFKNLSLEILIVLTGDAKKIWEKDNSPEMIAIKKDAIPYACSSYEDALVFSLKVNE